MKKTEKDTRSKNLIDNIKTITVFYKILDSYCHGFSKFFVYI